MRDATALAEGRTECRNSSPIQRGPAAAWGGCANGRPQQTRQMRYSTLPHSLCGFRSADGRYTISTLRDGGCLVYCRSRTAGVAWVQCERSTQAALRGKKVETHADLLATRKRRDRPAATTVVWVRARPNHPPCPQSSASNPGSRTSEALRKIEHAPSVGDGYRSASAARSPSCDSG